MGGSINVHRLTLLAVIHMKETVEKEEEEVNGTQIMWVKEATSILHSKVISEKQEKGSGAGG